jgi:hypothetical protein
MDIVPYRFYQWIWNLIYKIYDVQNTPFSGCFTQVFCYDDLIDNIVGLIGCQHQFNKYKKEYEREHKKKYVYHLDVQWDEVSGYNVKDDVEDIKYIDEYCVEFSDGNKQLILCPKTIVGSYIIPNSITSIGDFAFFDCSSLTSIVIPDGVTGIGEYAFFDCSSLTSIVIGNSVTSIGDGAFSNCSSLTSMFVENGNTTYDSRDNCNAIIETATNTLIAGCQNTTIPNSVTSIGDTAFLDCSSLTSLTIPNSVTSIGNNAFNGCTSLTMLDYVGTREQWTKIKTSGRWNKDFNIQIIHCTDGEIKL